MTKYWGHMRNAWQCRMRSGCKGQHGAGTGTGTGTIYLHYDTIHVGILSLYGIYFPVASRRADNSAFRVKHTWLDNLCSLSRRGVTGHSRHDPDQ